MVDWAQWTSKSYGSPGAASGMIGGSITVAYTGEIINTGDQGNWDEFSGTYTSSTVTNQPNPYSISIQLTGGNNYC
jgi:hypothetical protein